MSLKLHTNDFDLFELPQRFALARETLDARWKVLQREAHPDRFAAQGAAAQRVALQWSVRINEAYQRLKNPLKRAAYLCELHGVPLQAEHNTAMPASFLMQQMAWREALDEAQGELALQALADEVLDTQRALLQDCGRQIDEQGDYQGAAHTVRALMFVERFLGDVQDRLDLLGQ